MNDYARKRLTRSRQDNMLGGVCAGVADYFNIDLALVRVLTVVAALFSFGTVALAYVAAWVLMPES
ncbi:MULTISPECIES: PspC domain-containing protein [unclassified Nocardioides]|uniref:PspC domain-containing protein n=1 Tax=unclassified Nocardioides TaxID=2615069 RepID=UPI0007031449|nr:MULTISPECIES: PspC domain-containing protein [unclassified Nocardioides]KQZ75288.1 PspC family transcriptional regulator [Nocardioides sp. Root151]KRF14369.1 PspC family transcriptional regulator [Nocardioides sp. Soil796]